MKVAVIVIRVIIVLCMTAIISAVVFHDHHHRMVFVGSVALVASVAMYAAPLVVGASVFQDFVSTQSKLLSVIL